jgi:hypothetical protein
MDPVGRYLLIRAQGDSAWVVALGNERLIGAIQTAWRTDLPFIAVDGSIVVAEGGDAAFVDAATLRVTRRVPGGAADFWYPFRWAGFRQQDPIGGPLALDSLTDSTIARADTSIANAASAGGVGTDSGRAAVDTAAPRLVGGYIVSFAALLSEERARETAERIRVGDERPRVQPTPRDGSTIYRVILGPYPTRDDAERVGRSSGQPYWVYEAQPE